MRVPGSLGFDGLPIIQRAASSRPAQSQQQQQPLLDSGTPRSDDSSDAPTSALRELVGRAITMPTLPLPMPLSEPLRPHRAEEGGPAPASSTPAR